MATIVTIASSPSPRSRTDAVLARAVGRLADRGHTLVPVVLRDLPPDALLRGDTGDPRIAAAAAAIAQADGVLVTTPIYKAAYSGALKVFLDLLDQSAFRGKDVLPLASGGTPANVLALDYALRPVLESLGAAHVSPGRVILASLIETDELGRRVLTGAAEEVIDRVTDEFAERLEAHVAHRIAVEARRSVVIVGGGPRALGLVDRFSANLADEASGLALHVVDPHPAGAGRIWRADQDRLLWMNSTAADVTIFTDPSVTCEGPITSGPSLADWVAGEGRERLLSLGWPADTYGPDSFLPRGVQAEYLAWAWDTVRARLPEGVTLRVHRSRAVDVLDRESGRQRVVLASGSTVDADVVLLAQGHLDQQPTRAQHELEQAASERGLTYVRPGFTADLDLSVLRPGEHVLVRGLGLAFIDLAVLVAQARGGHFTGDGMDLTYHPSGREPILHAGSRRGVPYHAKLGYALAGGPAPLHHLTVDALDDLAGPAGTIDVATHVWPLVVTELTAAHYRQLFTAHPERTRGSWGALEALLVADGPDSAPFADAVAACVPNLADRFDLPSVDRPFQGRTFPDAEALQVALREHIRADLARRADPAFSSDRAVFDTLVSVYGFLANLLAAGRISTADRLTLVEGDFKGFFSFLASGPPPRRLAELLALQEAGIVRFLGPDARVDLDGDAFVGSSPAVPGQVRATALVDAFLARVDLAESADPLVMALLERGELRAERVSGPEGRQLGGLLTTDAAARAVRADGSVHPRRLLVGPSVSGSAGAAGFARPRFNGPAFRQNDRLARTILGDLGFAVPPARNITHFDPNRRGTDRARTTKEHVA